MLFVILLLLNLSIVHGVTNTFMDELFVFLRKDLLLKGNKMLATLYEARKLIKSLA